MAYNKETGMYEGYIYKIYNDVNDKIYIGQTTMTISYRWYGHKSQIKKHTTTDKLHNAMEKYGIDKFHIEKIKIYQCSTKELLIEQLDDAEKYYISSFNSYYNGYNSTKGGRDGVDHQRRPVIKYSLYGKYISEYESIEELKVEYDSVSTIYDCCMGNCKYAYGFIWHYKDDDTPLPILSEKEVHEATVRYLALYPIDKYDYKGNKIKTYKNINDVLKHENISRAKLMNACAGKVVYIGIYIYRFSCDSFDTYRTYRDKPKLVEQYDLDGNFIQVFESARAAARAIKLKGTQVSAVCNGKQKTAGGYMWKYVEDNSELPDLQYNGHCKQVYKYSKNNGNLICVYKSIQDAAINCGINKATASKMAYGKTQCISTNYVLSFKELTLEEIKNKTKNKNNKIVCQYTKDGVFVRMYDSLTDAGKMFEPKNAGTHIGSCCRKIHKTAYGFIWYFASDLDQPDKTKIIN